MSGAFASSRGAWRAQSFAGTALMSCWVVPSIAAELWGIPLEQLMGQIRAGAVTSKSEHGFTLVDVAPDSARVASAPRRRRPRTRTFTPIVEPVSKSPTSVVSDAEL